MSNVKLLLSFIKEKYPDAVINEETQEVEFLMANGDPIFAASISGDKISVYQQIGGRLHFDVMPSEYETIKQQISDIIIAACGEAYDEMERHKKIHGALVQILEASQIKNF